MIWTRLYTREGEESGKRKRYFWQSIGARLCVLHYLLKVVSGDGVGALEAAVKQLMLNL